MLSGYSQELRILPPNLTAQILVAFKKISDNLRIFPSKFEIPNPVMGAFRVLSGVASLASSYDCSTLCSFRDMTFFVIFLKVFSEKLK